MRKITDMITDKLIIDPSIDNANVLDEMIRQFKIDIISYKDHQEIILNLYYTLRTYFNDAVIYEVLQSTLTNEEIKAIERDYKFNKLGIK